MALTYESGPLNVRSNNTDTDEDRDSRDKRYRDVGQPHQEEGSSRAEVEFVSSQPREDRRDGVESGEELENRDIEDLESNNVHVQAADGQEQGRMDGEDANAPTNSQEESNAMYFTSSSAMSFKLLIGALLVIFIAAILAVFLRP